MTGAEIIARAAIEAAEAVTDGDENLQIVVMVRTSQEATELHGYTHLDGFGDLAAAAFILIHAKHLIENNGKKVMLGGLRGVNA